ncbi:MAG: hypothetical protein KGJ13_07140 [Patescibacteria group bacterium]|nr:hypothetical protein [Patescibacteria group bacterium]
MRKLCYRCRGEELSVKPGSFNWLCRKHADEELRQVAQKEKAAVKGSPALDRKLFPVFSGVLRYFPDALLAVAEVSRIGNEQHNPGQPLGWDRSKSSDELDALTRHLLDAGAFDRDGVRHSAKIAWRALANLQKELENVSKENPCAKQ